MRIGVYSVDGVAFPNVALMKIAAFHLDRGDEVEWALPFGSYDKVYESKLFTFTQPPTWKWNADEVIRGGTGYDIKSRLPDEMERITDVYWDLYRQLDFSVNFLSRGCIRHCPFCLVHDKEGTIRSVQPLSVPSWARRVDILDNNFFANPRIDDAMKWCAQLDIPIRLHGVDVRMMTDRHFEMLGSLRMDGHVHIAWDNPNDDLRPCIRRMLRYIKAWRIVCYVLVGFRSSIEQDLFRIRELDAMGIAPFVMVYRDYTKKIRRDALLDDLQRWCNRRWIFKSCSFDEYLSSRHHST